MDLDRLFQATFDELERPATGAIFPGFPGDDGASGKEQTADNIEFSRLSRFSRPEKRGLGSDQLFTAGNIDVSGNGDRARSVLFETPGNPGNPGKGGNTLAETDTYFFPEKKEEPGNPGKRNARSGHTHPDLNSAAPQRSDWRAGADMAEADRATTHAGAPPPIPSATIRAGVERELRALADDGREGPDALRDAIEITRAKIRNSEALAERQASGAACHGCDGPLDDSAPVVAVLTGRRGSHLFLHAGCCDAYTARRIALIDSIMAVAGYGADAEET